MPIAAMVAIATAPDGKPFTQGAYRYSRHPMILWGNVMHSGVSIASASWLFLLFSIAVAVLYHFLVVAEERGCLKYYGTAYRECVNRTPTIDVLSSCTLYLPMTCFTSSYPRQASSNRFYPDVTAPPPRRGRGYPLFCADSQSELGQILLDPIEFLFANLSSGVAFSDCGKSAISIMRTPGQPRNGPYSEPDNACPEENHQHSTDCHPGTYTFTPIAHLFTSI
jgi:hypothetical protein